MNELIKNLTADINSGHIPFAFFEEYFRYSCGHHFKNVSWLTEYETNQGSNKLKMVSRMIFINVFEMDITGKSMTSLSIEFTRETHWFQKVVFVFQILISDNHNELVESVAEAIQESIEEEGLEMVGELDNQGVSEKCTEIAVNFLSLKNMTIYYLNYYLRANPGIFEGDKNLINEHYALASKMYEIFELTR